MKLTQVKANVSTAAVAKKLASAAQSLRSTLPMLPASDDRYLKKGKGCLVRTSVNAKTYMKYSESAKRERKSLETAIEKLEARAIALGSKITVQKDVTPAKPKKKTAKKGAKKGGRKKK